MSNVFRHAAVSFNPRYAVLSSFSRAAVCGNVDREDASSVKLSISVLELGAGRC